MTAAKSEVDSVLVAMEAGIYNVKKATCGTYSCETCNGVTAGYLYPLNSFSVASGSSTQLNFIETWNSGIQYNMNGSSNWSSTNTSVATVTSSGLVTGVAAGVCNISAHDKFSEPTYTANFCGINLPACPVQPSSPPGGISRGTVPPTVTIQGNLFVYVGQDPTVPPINVLFGQGSPSNGTYAWSSPDTTISFDNNSAQDVHLTATTYNTTASNVLLNYSQNGVSANQASVNLTKRIFKFLAHDVLTKLATYNGPTAWGYSYGAAYNVFANPGGNQLTTGAGVSTYEQVTLVSNNYPFTPQNQNASLDPASRVLDTLALISHNGAIPAGVSIVQSQNWAVGGIFVRTNTLTMTTTGVTVTSQGPYN